MRRSASQALQTGSVREAVVRSLCGVAGVVAVAWPNRSNADGIELFLEAEKFDTELLMKQLKAKLPYYMVPRRIQTLPRLPCKPKRQV
jgi:hypothetical protein